MTPPVSATSTFNSDEIDPVLLKKANRHANGVNGKVAVDVKADDVVEDYTGKYKFAPVEESQVARAMIKRYNFKLPHATNDLTSTVGAGTLTLCTSVQYQTL